MSSESQTGPGPREQEPTEEELRAAYEAELGRITSAEMVLQSAVSLLNIGGYRLGAPASEAGGGGAGDLEQVRDAIDAVRGLMPVLERRLGATEIAPLRDALSRLQMAYAREAAERPEPESAEQSPGAGAPASGAEGEPAAQQPSSPGEGADAGPGPGPAESSGRLWVPGR